MKNLSFLSLLFVVLLSPQCDMKKGKEAVKKLLAEKPHIERFDDALNNVISEDAEVEILADGFEWSEGPLWIEGLGVIFSDIPPNKIFLWNENEGLKLYLHPSGYTGAEPRGGEPGANGLLLDDQGRLVLCQHGDRRIARMLAPLNDPKPEYETIVGSYNGKRFNSPNDACYDSKGNLYFTDPPYGLEKGMSDPLKELDFQGVYRFSANGQLTLLTKELSRPNGIALSPDEKMLYVSNSDPARPVIMRWALKDDGTLGAGTIFFDAKKVSEKNRGMPDGLKVSSSGTIFATGPGGVWIFDPSGKPLGRIRTGQLTSNCALSSDEKTLYMTADMYLMRVGLK